VVTRRQSNFYGCLLARGVRKDIDPNSDSPIAVAGHLVAYLSYDCDPDYVECYSYFEVVDLRSEHGLDTAVDPADIDGDSELGGLALRRDGALAWTECETPRPQCARGDEFTLYVSPFDGRERRVDAGTGLDPDSVRWRGARLTWTRGGVRRSTRVL